MRTTLKSNPVKYPESVLEKSKDSIVKNEQ